MFDNYSSYTIVYEDDKAIFITDDDHGLSVTNDAERVCNKLLPGRRSKRIFYRDTDRRWEEMTHSGFQFTSFSLVTNTHPLYELFKTVTNKY